MTVLWVALAAAVAAPLRYVIDRSVQQTHRTRMPFGTLTVNLIASLVLGLMAGLHPASQLALGLVSVGFCGTLSTYSTFSFEHMRLHDRGEHAIAVGYVTLSVVAGCGIAALGWCLGAAIR